MALRNTQLQKTSSCFNLLLKHLEANSNSLEVMQDSASVQSVWKSFLHHVTTSSSRPCPLALPWRFGSQLRGLQTTCSSQGSAASMTATLPWALRGIRGGFGQVFRFKSTATLPMGEAAAAGATVRLVEQTSKALSEGLPAGARRQLMWWLGGSAAWVYSMVVLGGVTRLTRSGLSMTDWKFTGEQRPQTEEEWEAEFAKYKESPEFKKVHSRMKLDEFKFIYWMEYAHRMWGRLLGVGFVVPGAYFLARRYITGAMAKRLGLLFFMGGTQGLVGWWMVRSGLQEPEHEWQTPRVSPYRLAAHLVSAFTIYATLAWTTLDLAHPKPLLAGLSQEAAAVARRVRGVALPFGALVAVTATSGAFVAGLDAGRAYNTFPLMAGRWIPAEYWSHALPGLRNFFENTAAVQWDHRVLATLTATSALGLWAWARGMPLPPQARHALDLVAAITSVQFALGIWTLLDYVPVHLGSLHQANALNLFTAVLFLLHTLRPAHAGPLTRASARFGAPLAATLVASVGYAVTAQQ